MALYGTICFVDYLWQSIMKILPIQSTCFTLCLVFIITTLQQSYLGLNHPWRTSDSAFINTQVLYCLLLNFVWYLCFLDLSSQISDQEILFYPFLTISLFLFVLYFPQEYWPSGCWVSFITSLSCCLRSSIIFVTLFSASQKSLSNMLPTSQICFLSWLILAMLLQISFKILLWHFPISFLNFSNPLFYCHIKAF